MTDFGARIAEELVETSQLSPLQMTGFVMYFLKLSHVCIPFLSRSADIPAAFLQLPVGYTHEDA